MRLRVFYFAQAARLSGVGEEQFELDGDSPTLATLQERVLRAHPELAQISSNLQWAVDEEIAAARSPLRDGATVAVLPPFSGG